VSARGDGEHHVTGTLRGYRYTVIYICITVTLVLGLLVYDLVHGPIPTPCP
jgi:hypothetical protein